MSDLPLIRNRIRSQVLLAVVLPVAVLTLTLTVYLVSARYNDLELSEEERGRLMAEGLAHVATYSLLAGDVAELERIAHNALQHPLTIGVSFYDNNGALVYQQGKTNGIAAGDNPSYPRTIVEGDIWYFTHPVSEPLPIVVDYNPGNVEDTSEEQQFGWVSITMSRSAQIARERQILVTAIVVAASCLLVGVIFALRVGRLISAPISQLTRAASEWSAGKGETRAEVMGTEETRLLATVLNQLASQVQQNARLQEHRINEATASLTERNTELERIQRELEQVMQAKDLFLARMSHELRTPLTSIIGFNRLIAATEDVQQRKDYSEIIDQASVLLLSIIDDILDHSKLSAQAVSLDKIPFDLEECFQNVVNLHAASAMSKALELVLLIDADVPTQVIGDAKRLQQVVNNLVGNAMKFTHEGNVIVIVSSQSSSGTSVTLDCEILDSGVGIAPENQARLFQPFAQADNSIAREHGGTGLGLVNSQALIHLMGGTIELDSAPDIGTRVHFSFQLELPESNDETGTLLPDREYSVLVSDANRWSQRALRTLLSRATNQVTLVSNLRDCIQRIGNNPQPDIVILSLEQAQSSPANLQDRLAEIRLRYQGPVVVISPVPDLKQQLGNNHDHVAFLSKPVQRRRLLALCDEMAGLVAPTSTEEELPQATPKVLEGLCVLIAEDNTLNRDLIGRMLAHYGAQTDLVSNGMEAIASAANGSHDLLILDLHMPRLDGISAAKAIRSSQPQLPIICLTADISETQTRELGKAGVNTILHKPIDETTLVASVCKELDLPEPSLPNGGELSVPTDEFEAVQINLRELLKQCRKAYQAQDLENYHETMHQLLGLAGMYQQKAVLALTQELKEGTAALLEPEVLHLLGEIEDLIDAAQAG